MEQDQSSYAPFARMQTSRDAPNPLRPYYLPPSIGLPPDPTEANANATRGASAGLSSRSRDFRDLFSDIDYGDYLPGSSPSVANIAKTIVDQAIWNYTSVFLAQPFEVAKVVLQCHMASSSTSIPSQSPSSSSSKRFNQDGYVDARYDVGSLLLEPVLLCKRKHRAKSG
jgi:fusion and transport protein UGO1